MNSVNQRDKKNISRRTFLKQTGQAAAALAVAGTLPVFSPATASARSDRDFDILIKGGTLYDGTLNAPGVADIGIKGDRIAAAGDLAGAQAARTINAKGLAVTPGFIDVHTHCDMSFQNMNSTALAGASSMMKGNYNYIYQGVTTVITGNCGLGIPRTDQWFDMAKAMSFGTNVAHLAPHGEIRADLFGVRQPAELTPAQLKAFLQRMTEELEKGAVGFSTGLEYAPGLLSSTGELIELARLTARSGKVYVTHVRNETGAVGRDGKPGVISALEEAVLIGKKAGISVEVSHLKVMAPNNAVPASAILDIIEKARSEGLDIHADQYPYDAGSTYITHLIPNKFKANDQSLKNEFRTEKGFLEIRKALEETFSYLPAEKILIANYPAKAELEGKTVAEIARIRGKSPAECYVEMVCEPVCPMAIFFAQNMDIVAEIMKRDYVLTASDGETYTKGVFRPHPRVYGAFPRKLRMVAFDNSWMSVEKAIRSMTSLPAKKFNLKNRGKIARGFFADIAVIDLPNFRDTATYLDPHQYAAGIKHLLINGVAAVTDGQATGAGGGVALKF